jgi:hypothetical protein
MAKKITVDDLQKQIDRVEKFQPCDEMQSQVKNIILNALKKRFAAFRPQDINTIAA